MNSTIDMDIFKEASRLKLRFPHKGIITTEDLWDLNLEQLDSIYKTLNKDVTDTKLESLLTKKRDIYDELYLKLDIIKLIFNEKKAYIDEQKKAAENREKRQRILEILAKKQDDSLLNKSEAELLEMLNELK